MPKCLNALYARQFRNRNDIGNITIFVKFSKGFGGCLFSWFFFLMTNFKSVPMWKKRK